VAALLDQLVVVELAAPTVVVVVEKAGQH